MLSRLLPHSLAESGTLGRVWDEVGLLSLFLLLLCHSLGQWVRSLLEQKLFLGVLSSSLQDAPQEQLKVPLSALPSGQVVRLVFPTSQVLECQKHGEGWAPCLTGLACCGRSFGPRAMPCTSAESGSGERGVFRADLLSSLRPCPYGDGQRPKGAWS